MIIGNLLDSLHINKMYNEVQKHADTLYCDLYSSFMELLSVHFPLVFHPRFQILALFQYMSFTLFSLQKLQILAKHWLWRHWK